MQFHNVLATCRYNSERRFVAGENSSFERQKLLAQRSVPHQSKQTEFQVVASDIGLKTDAENQRERAKFQEDYEERVRVARAKEAISVAQTNALLKADKGTTICQKSGMKPDGNLEEISKNKIKILLTNGVYAWDDANNSRICN